MGALQAEGGVQPCSRAGHHFGCSLKLQWNQTGPVAWGQRARQCLNLFSSASFSHFHSNRSKLPLINSTIIIRSPNLWSNRENSLPSNNPSLAHYLLPKPKYIFIFNLSSCPRKWGILLPLFLAPLNFLEKFAPSLIHVTFSFSSTEFSAFRTTHLPLVILDASACTSYSNSLLSFIGKLL